HRGADPPQPAGDPDLHRADAQRGQPHPGRLRAPAPEPRGPALRPDDDDGGRRRGGRWARDPRRHLPGAAGRRRRRAERSARMTAQAAALAVLLLPAAGCAYLGMFNWRGPRILTAIVGPGVVWLSFLLVLYLVFSGAGGDYTYWTWVRAGALDVPANLQVDRLSLFMCLVVTGVGGLIVTYAVGYMEHENDASYARFFAYMDVFVFSMLLLVLAG